MASRSTGTDRTAPAGRVPRGTGRQRLLDAAEELFARQGFAATTTRELAERAGTSTGVVFYHFPSKEALLASLLAERSPYADLGAILEQHTDDPRDGLRALTVAIDRTVAERGTILRIMLHGEDEAIQALFRRFVDDSVSTLAAYLRRSLGVSVVDEAAATAMARSFLSTVLLSRLVLDPPGQPRDLSSTIEVLLHGYR